MTPYLGGSPISTGPFGHPEIERIFSDEQLVAHLLEVETALARTLAELDLIPASARDEIERAASDIDVDHESLAEGAARSGWPVIDLVQQLRSEVGDEAERYVHWGATTQDIMDTARVLQVRQAVTLIADELGELISGLAQLARQHRDLVMVGRTHSQPALPITFGYKVAMWMAPLLRHQQRLVELQPRLMVVQFGGASGTLAAYGERGPEIASLLAHQLGLTEPVTPWHTQRDGMAELAGWLSLVSGSLGKIAQDIILLAQFEIGEVRETADKDAGVSSAMPQKSNPIQSELILAAARANAALLSAVHQAQIQEHERGTHGAFVEWMTLPQMLALTGGAVARSRGLTAELVIEEARIQHNLEATQGTLLAEAIRLALLETMPPAMATATLKKASERALAETRPLTEVVKEMVEVELDWTRLADETQYLGACGRFVDRIVEQASKTPVHGGY